MSSNYENVMALPLLPLLNMIEVVAIHHGGSFFGIVAVRMDNELSRSRFLNNNATESAEANHSAV
jgi:hypothetical protein